MAAAISCGSSAISGSAGLTAVRGRVNDGVAAHRQPRRIAQLTSGSTGGWPLLVLIRRLLMVAFLRRRHTSAAGSEPLRPPRSRRGGRRFGRTQRSDPRQAAADDAEVKRRDPEEYYRTPGSQRASSLRATRARNARRRRIEVGATHPFMRMLCLESGQAARRSDPRAPFHRSRTVSRGRDSPSWAPQGSRSPDSPCACRPA
jgi:hypothetical protein